MTFKPHFRKVDGQWRLYRDRKEFRRGCHIWYALTAKTPQGMWAERNVLIAQSLLARAMQ